MRKRAFIFLLSFFIFSIGVAQKISPSGKFINDSIQIGEPVPFVLSVKYPKELEIIFPDSLYDFSPFELTSKKYFSTNSDSIFSTDSAVYYLSTFEIDSFQYLRIPIYRINEFDSTVFWTTIDSIILKQVVTAIPDSVAMITNTEYIEVPMAFNYPYATIGLMVLLIFVMAVWFIFGKTIKNKITIYRLKKRNLKFVDAFDILVQDNYTVCEPILNLWKSYLEKLKGEPYTKLTTKEIAYILTSSKDVEIALIAIDKNIYGPKDESLLENAYTSIKEIALNEYKTKVNQILHG